MRPVCVCGRLSCVPPRSPTPSQPPTHGVPCNPDPTVQATFQVPPWHSVLLASRLITMLRTDLETGLLERTVSALQWRHEAVMER
jgi:hypothetical protein